MLKKAPFQLPDANLIVGRQKAYERIDRDLYIDTGFFVARFSTVELCLTALLAGLSGATDIEAFDILCRGMDARVKTQRLRQAAQRCNGLGPNFSVRLEKFEKGAIPLRNKLVHSALTHSEGEMIPSYYLSGIGNLPWSLSPELKQPTKPQKPDEIRSIDLYAWGLWLSFFADDLTPLINLAQQRGRLEIAQPKSRLQSEDHPGQHHKARYAKVDRPPQTPEE